MRNRYEDGGSLPKICDIFNGEVANVTTYGAFVKIPGCRKQGLVHKSQMSSARIEDPNEMLAKGEKVFCKVIAMEEDGEKISLSMKVVNQTTGQDLDINNVQSSQDEKKRRQWKFKGENKIELGAELNTTCRKCGGHGHFAIDCFVGKGNAQYDLIPDIDTLTELPPLEEREQTTTKPKKKKKEKKKKEKTKKKKRHKSTSSSCSADQSDEDNGVKRRKSSKHSKYSSDSNTRRKEKKMLRHRSSSSYSDDSSERNNYSKSSKSHKKIKLSSKYDNHSSDSHSDTLSNKVSNSKEQSKRYSRKRSRSPVILKNRDRKRHVSDSEEDAYSRRRESRSPDNIKYKDSFRSRHVSNYDSEQDNQKKVSEKSRRERKSPDNFKKRQRQNSESPVASKIKERHRNSDSQQNVHHRKRIGRDSRSPVARRSKDMHRNRQDSNSDSEQHHRNRKFRYV